MQKWVSNILTLLFVVLFISLTAQSESVLLTKADSLYNKKKYAEAQQIYYQLFQKGYFTSSTLLKMAFVYEGLGDTPKALFFLTQFYNQTEDSKAYDKILILSNAHNLKGYELNDLDRALMWIRNRMTAIISVLLILAVITLTSLLTPFVRKLPNVKVALGVFSIFLFSMALVVENFGSPVNKGVISKKTYVMNGPSPGANFLTILDGGNQVPILDTQDVWVKINWNDKVGYVKKSDVLWN